MGNYLQEIVNLFQVELEAENGILDNSHDHYKIYLPNGVNVPCKKLKLYYTGNQNFIVAGGRVAGNLYIVIGLDVVLQEMDIYLVDAKKLNHRIGSMSSTLGSLEFPHAIMGIELFEDIHELFISSTKALFKKDIFDDKWVEQVI